MIQSTSDYWFAIGVVVMMPLIIWGNLRNNRQGGGLMGYLWREAPWLAGISLVFLGLIWLASVASLAAFYGLVSVEATQLALTVLGIPMLVLSVAILVMAAAVTYRHLSSRSGT